MTKSGKVESLDPNIKALVDRAIKAQKNAYAPYSQFKVGCAIETETGRVLSGCNVENVGLTLTVHAEIHALCNLQLEGRDKCKILLIVTPVNEPIFPCGQCRQFISEQAPQCEVYSIDCTGENYLYARIEDLLPHVYEREHLFESTSS